MTSPSPVVPRAVRPSRRNVLVLAAGGAVGALTALAGRPDTAVAVDVDADELTVTPATSTATINAWLARRDPTTGVRRLRGTAVLTAPLVVLGGTVLDATGASVTGPARDNVLRNAAATPAVTTTATVSAGSTTVTTARGVFTAAMVGRRVQVLGAGPRGGRVAAPGSMYGRITAVRSSTTVTLSVPATTSLTGATTYVFPPNDAGITITGGTWTNRGKNALSQRTTSHGMLLRRVSGVTLSGFTVRSDGARQVGGQYAVSLGDVTDVRATDLTFVRTASDGIHFQGPAARITLQRITGDHTGDDLVAFTTVDGQSKDGSLLGDCEGDISDVVVEGVDGTACHTHLKLTSGTGAAGVQRRLQRFTASGISGTATGGSPVNVVDYAGPTWFSGTIADVTATKDNSPMVNCNAVTLGTVVVRDVTWPAASPAPVRGIVRFAGRTATSLTVDGVTNRSVRPTSDGGSVAAVTVAVKTIGSLTVSRVACPVLAPSFDSVQLVTSDVGITTLRVSDDSSAARAGNVFSMPAAAARYRVRSATFTRISRSTGSVWAATADGTRTTTDLVVDGMTGGRAVALLRSPARVVVRNAKQSSAAKAAVRLDSANASPVRVTTSAFTRASPLVSRTARQSVSASSTTVGVDAALLAPRNGDVVRNTGSRWPSGLVRWDAAARRWVRTTAPTSPAPEPTPKPTPTPTPTRPGTPSPTPTSRPVGPTPAPTPTSAPVPTGTPTPTATPVPTGTPSPSVGAPTG
ncbi:hypothetical protein [Curtobacterium aetherium]|uniref:Uncharacterized protein n=1 Tax=Curtobacterium aetherium TaxID=2841594 RepID=A0ACD1E1J4_9MICO|nr:hypothetical protein [Curtobacterium sp. L6-1]QWS32785.1 hypothetical protein KM842_10930 [Curtobacterium sp. L6-1]